MIKLWKKERWLLVPCPDYDVAAMEAWLGAAGAEGSVSVCGKRLLSRLCLL